LQARFGGDALDSLMVLAGAALSSAPEIAGEDTGATAAVAPPSKSGQRLTADPIRG